MIRFQHKLLTLFCPLLILSASPIVNAETFLGRDDVQAFIADLHVRDDIPIADLESAFEKAESIPKVIELIRPPADPGVRSWKRYRSRFIEPKRISAGIDFWNTHRQALEQAEKTYGVPAEIIAGIIGVETIYGRNTGGFQTLSALATLAFDYPPRAPLFLRELEQLFLLAREQSRDVSEYRGSFAGALGLPQFLPSSIREFAVDGDGDGRIDLKTSAEDAIFSVANFLAKHGWQRGEPITIPVAIPNSIDVSALLESGIEPRLTKAALREYGIPSESDGAETQPFALVDLVTPGEDTQYWLGYRNFYVITRYNHSSFYAMAVFDLAQALKIEFGIRSEMKHSSRPTIKIRKKQKA